MEKWLNKIHTGEALELMKQLPSESVDCIITSPPYYALRDYQVEGQIGLEPTFDDYINRLCDIFNEAKRVLKKTGTVWVNLGDTYYGSGAGTQKNNIKPTGKQVYVMPYGSNRTRKTKLDSKQLDVKFNLKKKFCSNCGKNFEALPNQYFCGSACSGVDNTPRNVKDVLANWERPSRSEYNSAGIVKDCLYCGIAIKGKPNSQFCSRECLNKMGNNFRTQRRLLPNKCLTMVPERFAIEMVNRGWILRNQIIWHKPNAMPSSVKDRFTVDYEKVFLFVKSKKYYFETQYEPVQQSSIARLGRAVSNKNKWVKGANGQTPHNLSQPRLNINKLKGIRPKGGDDSGELGNNVRFGNTIFNNYKRLQYPMNPHEFYGGDHLVAPFNPQLGRNKRSVWSIPTQPFKEAHFAVYPEKLIETPIKAGCPEFVCNQCGKIKKRIEKVIGEQVTDAMIKAGADKHGNYYGKEQKDYDSAKANKPSETKKRILKSMSQIKEFSYQGCECNVGFSGGIVLDPFAGSCTTAIVSEKLNRNWIMFDLNPTYVEMGKKRIKELKKKINQTLDRFN